MHYPESATGDHSLIIELVIAADGRVQDAEALTGEPPFRQAAVDSAMAWVFEPARRDGKAVPARIRMRVVFTQLPPPEPPPSTEALPATAANPERSAGAEPVRSASIATDDSIDVTVRGERTESERRLSRAEVRELPGAFGDPFRAVEVLPGVTPIVSGLPYFFVRGAPPGDVGYRFDGIPVPQLYHLLVGPGVLHPAFVENVHVHGGAYPARLGRFIGGIVTADARAPTYDWRGELSVRLLDAGAMAEAPFADSQGSVMLGGRYSYAGALLSLLSATQSVDYWDYQSRVRYDIDENDTVEVLAFGAGDLLAERREDSQAWKTNVSMDFHRFDLRWDHRWTTGSLRQAASVGIDRSIIDDETVRFASRQAGLRTELSQALGSNVSLRMGADGTFEWLEQRVDKPAAEIGEVNEEYRIDENGMQVLVPPPAYEPTEDSLGFDPRRDDLTLGAHAGLVVRPSQTVELTAGVRGDVYAFGDERAMSVEPRVAARYQVTEELAITHDLGIVRQPPSFTLPLPGAKPSLQGGLQSGVKHSAGTELTLGDGWSTSVELFQNLFWEMTDILGVDQIAQARDQQADTVRAKGRSFGLEFMLRRNFMRRLGMLVSYTWSRSERGVGHLETPSAVDRTHVVNAVASYDLGYNWRLGSRLLLYTGTPVRVPADQVSMSPPRAPAFWRLDWRLSKCWPHSDGSGYWALVLEVLNTTLNTEVTSRDCSVRPCVDERTDPITFPNLGVEVVF